MLKNFTITGKVIKGKKRGGKIGIPTANLRWRKMKIPFGVYASFTTVGKNTKKSVPHIGPIPSFRQPRPSIETHILDYRRNIRGKTITIEIKHKLRNIRNYRDQNKLLKQIKQDINQTKCLLGSLPRSEK